MTTFTELQDLIDDATTALTTFNGILGQLQAELSDQSLLPEEGVTQQPIEYIKAGNGTITFILKQATANTTDGKYKGVYRLPLPATSSRLKNVTLVSPANPNDITAQLRDPVSDTEPNPTFGSPQAISTLEDECINAITLLSVGPFELRLRLEDSCGVWCCEFDFAVSNGGFSSLGTGTYTPGVGWEDNLTFVGGNTNRPRRQLQIERSFTPTVITHIEVEFTRTLGITSAVSGTGVWTNSFGTTLTSIGLGSSPIIWDGSMTMDDLQISIAAGGKDTAGDPGGTATLLRMLLRGEGANPFGEDNCE